MKSGLERKIKLNLIQPKPFDREKDNGKTWKMLEKSRYKEGKKKVGWNERRIDKETVGNETGK